ncbi:tetratricopeptide repeat protein [Ferruginibacter sp. SUN002]|uniref:tetratricopeptide repeat protein n=1 Tax=Ferruginibacter sp. SUN002 TaxID=2937789 RepID=UPI003D35EE65
MKKQQIILAAGGLCLLTLLLFFGRTVAKKEPSTAEHIAHADPKFSVSALIKASKQSLAPYRVDYLNLLEKKSIESNSTDDKIKSLETLAVFWEDSVHNHDLHLFYTSEAAKLVNSEKNLTFAARLILANLRNEQDIAKRGWKAEQAIELFDKAIELNPTNDSLKIGKGSCYVFGKGMAGNAEETMKGIQLLLGVVRKDSTNMQAQLVLGIGGVISTQFDKAIVRLQTVVNNQPNNLEAISWLADAYAGKGDKQNAIKWYQRSKEMVNDPEYSKEVDERIKEIK